MMRFPTPEELTGRAVDYLCLLLENDNRHNECAMVRAVIHGDLDHQHALLAIAMEHDVRGYLTESEVQERAKIVAEVMGQFDI